MKFVKATICLSVLLALSACSEKETVDSHLTSAKSYLAENKVNESIIALKNAIRIDVKNAEARFLLGKVYLELGDGVAAEKELSRAKSLKYQGKELIPLLARALILTEADDDVIALSTEANSLDKEQHSHFLAYKTLAALRSENIELAKETVASAQSLTEQGQYSLLAQAYLQLAENENEQADLLVKRVLTIDENQPDALMLQGQIATVMKDYSLASESYKRYIQQQPRSGVVQLLLADSLLKAGESEEAEKLADTILAKVANQPFALYIKAMVRFEEQDYKVASELAERALSNNFNQFSLKLVAGASAFYLNNWEQCYYHLNSIVKYLPAEHQGRRMLAVSQLELGLVDEISATLGDFNGEKEADAQFLSSLSFKLLELGATEEAKKLLVQSQAQPTGDANQNARQGILKLMMNDPSGMQDLKDAVKINPEFVEAELALAYASLQANDVEQAKNIANKWQEKYPEKAGGFNLMASVHIKQQDFSKAEQLLEQSLEKESNNLFALTEQLRIARLQQNDELSKQRADNLISLYPQHNKVLRHYFGVYKNEQALSKLAEAYQAKPTDLQKALLYSEALLSLNEIKKAQNVLVNFENDKQLPKRFWQVLVLTYKQLQEQGRVQSTLEQWMKQSPYHLEPVILLADYYANQRNFERALSVIKRGFDSHPDNVILQLLKMQLLLNSKQLQPAKELYQTIAVRDVDDNLKQGLLGRILMLEGKFVQAVPKMENFYKAYTNSQNAIYLAAAYMGNNEKNKAQNHLVTYLKANPDDVRIKALLANLYLGDNNDKALDVYADIIKAQPNNVLVNNNLAWLYLEQGEVDKALFHAKAAIKSGESIPNVVDTYAKVLLKKGDLTGALSQSSRASELAKGKDVDIELNYAEILIANSRQSEARKIIKKITTKTAAQNERKTQLSNQL
ncbi:XrtA/PEP-CTERM system TPR-repeat protein PrsT [Litorilituus lipolyticus]|uniref:PEP-CTERM system TPR-repeat protein PrsT n=1 Tax=Litorilituus lipolyticus TaxID=2491017 RepID=A0A502KVF6_9GAMM|nr:XrtA/PEP-CTERM system TPR-repeat protein PrsT [Litorilituus lipolyticus]TPH15552.1 PEP-CTERM system TPR-repeat protein PrsT [Litorilituus lipolyticus]